MDGSYLTLWISFFSWVTLYFSLCLLNPKRSYEWHCRTVTVIHAIVITSLAAWCAFIQGPWPFTDAGGPNTPLQLFTVTLCLGYFTFDFLWCLYFQTEGAVMLFHHCMSLFGLYVTFHLGKYGTEMVATICGAEVTNPFLQLRWFLRETGNYDTLLGEIVDHTFMILFGLVRIFVGAILLYCYFQQPTDSLGRFGGIAIYTISWIFWISIIQYAIKKYQRKFKNWKSLRNNSRKVLISSVPDKISRDLLTPNGGSHTSGTLKKRQIVDNDSLDQHYINGYIKEDN